MFHELADLLTPPTRRHRRPVQRVRLVTAVAEALERRRLLTATYSFTSGTLAVSDNTGYLDTIIVQPDGSGNVQVLVNGTNIVSPSIALSGVTAITITNPDMNDTLTVDSGITVDATITGGSGAEVITGGGGNDSLIGNGGTDSITGGAGNDTLEGGAGDDTLAGGTGNDTYKFSGSTVLGSDTIQESPVGGTDTSSDTLDFSGINGTIGIGSNAAHFDLSSVAAQDVLIASPTVLTLTLLSGTGIENVYGTPNTDFVQGNSRPNNLQGRNGDSDMLWGGDGNDTLDGGAGDKDCVHGQDGNDVEYGGIGDDDDVGFTNGESDDAGNDTLYGGGGNDDVRGGSGADVIYGDDGSVAPNPYTGGNDVCYGGGENDTIYGGPGNDVLHGEDGNDVVYGDCGSVSGASNINEGDDTLYGEAGTDTMYGDTHGGAQYGWQYGNDSLNGGDSADTMYGDGNDPVGYGAFGTDTLEGGLGFDTLVGENGPDVYAFNADSSQDLGTDTITESASGTTNLSGNDTIDLSGLAGGSGATLDISSNSSQTVVLSHLVLVLSSGTGIENVTGTQYGDSITGNSLNNNLLGGAGNDTIHGGDGNDTIQGDSGRDLLYGENGNDTFKVNDLEADTVDGGAGTDTADSDGLDSLINM